MPVDDALCMACESDETNFSDIASATWSTRYLLHPCDLILNLF